MKGLGFNQGGGHDLPDEGVSVLGGELLGDWDGKDYNWGGVPNDVF
jgi:hypothetical protein